MELISQLDSRTWVVIVVAVWLVYAAIQSFRTRRQKEQQKENQILGLLMQVRNEATLAALKPALKKVIICRFSIMADLVAEGMEDFTDEERATVRKALPGEFEVVLEYWGRLLLVTAKSRGWLSDMRDVPPECVIRIHRDGAMDWPPCEGPDEAILDDPDLLASHEVFDLWRVRLGNGNDPKPEEAIYARFLQVQLVHSAVNRFIRVIDHSRLRKRKLAEIPLEEENLWPHERVPESLDRDPQTSRFVSQFSSFQWCLEVIDHRLHLGEVRSIQPWEGVDWLSWRGDTAEKVATVAIEHYQEGLGRLYLPLQKDGTLSESDRILLAVGDNGCLHWAHESDEVKVRKLRQLWT